MASVFSRQNLLALLEIFERTSSEVSERTRRLREFVEQDESCAERANPKGHLTASAWVVSADRTKALLLHHRKLNKWIQPGGHADGDFDLLSVALREVKEESGLTQVVPASSDIFDVDIHEIPPWRDTPAHLHYDVRFLIEADEFERLTHNDESNALRWVELYAVPSYTEEESVLRMARATLQLSVAKT